MRARIHVLVLLAACTRAAPEPAGQVVPALPAVPRASEPAPSAPEPAPSPWRWESAFGLEVEVPSAWSINDIGCNMTDAPTFVRAIGAERLCLTPEAAHKQVIEVARYAPGGSVKPPAGLRPRPVSLAGEPAERAQGRAEDGRLLGFLHVPRLRAVLSLRVLELSTANHVLDSARAISVDRNGCGVLPEQSSPRPPSAAESLVPNDTTTIALCYFAAGDVLAASAALRGVDAQRVAKLLNALGPGRNADPPRSECAPEPATKSPDLTLIASSAADSAVVQLRFSGCRDRGLYNGRSNARINDATLHELMRPLHTGYSFSPLWPAGAIPPAP